MNKPEPYDGVIIGAGPAGSSLAAVLAGLGWHTLLVEQQRLPRHKVCGEFLSPEAQASLAAMDLYQTVAALNPVPITRAVFVSRLGLTVRMELPGQAWGLSRFALDAALATAAERAGAIFQDGVKAISVVPVGRVFEVMLQTRDGSTTTVRARAVIAACGRYSLPGLPPRAATSSPSRTYLGLKGHYEGVTMPAQVEIYLLRGGYAGLNPVEGNRVNFCLLVDPAVFAQSKKGVSAMLATAARWHPALHHRLENGTALPETAVAVAPVNTSRPAEPWEGMACLGDTAIMIPPLCGDGMAMAVRSAELCVPLIHDFLRGRLSLAGWEAAYRRLWRTEFAGPVRVGRGLQTILAVPLLSDALIGLGNFTPPLTKLLVQATRGRPRAVETMTSIVRSRQKE